MSDNETFLLAKVQFLAQQLTSAIDALCDASGNSAVWKAKYEAATTELQALKPKEDAA